MSDGDWITQKLAAAKADRLLVMPAVSARIEELLRGQLGEWGVSKGDLANAAKDLLAKSAPDPPEEAKVN